MGWQDSPIVTDTPKNAWESAPIVNQPSSPSTQENTPNWAGDSPNLYGAYGAVKEAIVKPLAAMPGSMTKTAWDIAKGATYPIRHPIETAKIPSKIGSAIFEHPIETAEAIWNTGSEVVKQRYGSLENLKNTVQTEPMTVLGDIAKVVGGIGGIAKGVGAITGIEGLSKFGAEAMVAGGKTFTAPYSAVSKIASPIIKAGTATTKQVLGMVTGEGKNAIEQAIKGSPAFRAGIKGEITQEDILATTKDALNMVRDERAQDYIAKLEDIKNIKPNIDITPIRDKLAKNLKDFNIKISPDGLDFSRATLDRKAFNDIQTIYDKVMGWGTQTGDRTPAGLDILKRTLDDFYTESNNSRAFVTSLKNEVKNTLIKEVPEYATMTKNYEETSNFLKEFDKALSTGKQATADMAIRKLMSTQRENFEFRKTLLDNIEKATGKDIQGMIAGVSMQQITPHGLIGKLGAGADVVAAITLSSPTIASALLMASPRVVGEFLYWLGKGKQGLDKASFLLGNEVKGLLSQAAIAAKESQNIKDPFNIRQEAQP